MLLYTLDVSLIFWENTLYLCGCWGTTGNPHTAFAGASDQSGGRSFEDLKRVEPISKCVANALQVLTAFDLLSLANRR